MVGTVHGDFVVCCTSDAGLRVCASHAVAGKWDTGAATYAHTPEGRGYNSSLIYFSHAVDYFTHRDYDGVPSPDEVHRDDVGAYAIHHVQCCAAS